MRLSDFNECICRMREIYMFNEPETDVQLTRDPRNVQTVEIKTYDEKTDVEIRLSASPVKEF